MTPKLIFVKKTIVKFVSFFIFLILICVAAYYANKKYEDRNQIMKELDGIALGESLKDATFKKGIFESSNQRLINLLEESLTREKLSPEKKVEYTKLLMKAKEDLAKEKEKKSFDLEIGETQINVENSKVIHITHECKEYDLTSINGITCNSSSEKILEKYDRKIRILCPKEKSANSDIYRVYDSVEYGVRYFLMQNKVTAFTIANPETLINYININWSSCE